MAGQAIPACDRWPGAAGRRSYAEDMGQDSVGTAGWTDRTLIASGWYPPEANNAGEAAAVLRPPVPAGGGGRHLLRAARRADRHGLGGADPGRVHLQHQGVQPVHPAPHPGQGAARRPARGRGPGRQGPGVPQGRRPGGDRPGVGPVPGRAGAAAPGRASSARSCCSSRPGSRSPGRTRTTSWPARSGSRRAGCAWSSATTPG